MEVPVISEPIVHCMVNNSNDMNITATVPARSPVVYAEVPFRFLSPTAPLLMVRAKVNGKGPFEFVLDTGNGSFPLLIAPSLAASLAIPMAEGSPTEGFTVELNQSFHLGKVSSFELGALQSGQTDVAVSPAIAEVNDKLGAHIDGNIGYPYLKAYALTFDFKRSVLTLSSKAPEGKSVPIGVDAKAPIILLDVMANGQKLRFVLDTGASTTCISRGAAAGIGLKLGEAMALNRAPTANSNLSSLDMLEVAEKSERDLRIVVADFLDPLSREVGVQIDGVLGFNFWKRYRMTIDYPGKRLMLEDEQ